MLDDFFDFFDWWIPETEEIRKAKEALQKAREELREAQRKALEERASEAQQEEAIVPTSMLSIPMMGSEEAFRTACENFARAHPDYEVKGFSKDWDNGFYRSLSVRTRKKE